MLRFTFEDGSRMFIDGSKSVITNKGTLQADQVTVGTYVRCGTVLFCRVDDVTAV